MAVLLVGTLDTKGTEFAYVRDRLKAAGVPVIATAAGGTGEIMHHDVDGWVVPVGSRESLTHAIRYLLSHADVRARLAEQGRRQVVADHSVRKLTDDTEAALAGA